MPDTSSPTRWVSRMYAAQQAAAPSAYATPTTSTAPRQGSVSSRTPTAAGSTHNRATPRPRQAATDSGPRNSSALAVPSGSRAAAAMNSMVIPAVTIPSAMQASRLDRLNQDRRGRTNTSSSTPAQASRSQAAPSGPSRSNRPTDAARPSWTKTIADTAMPAPVRVVLTMFRSDQAPTVRVHIISSNKPFMNHGQCCQWTLDACSSCTNWPGSARCSASPRS